MPPATESAVDQAVAALVTLLESIQGGASYYTTVAQVRRGATFGAPDLDYPVVMVVVNDQSEDDADAGSVDRIEAVLSLTLYLALKSWGTTDERDLAIGRFIADVQKAVRGDDSLGGVVLQTIIDRVSRFEYFGKNPCAGAAVNVQIQLRYERTDPFNLIPN